IVIYKIINIYNKKLSNNNLRDALPIYATPEEEPLPDELTVLAENLNAPWSIEKIENTFYITERSGAIVKVEDEEETRQEVELSKDPKSTRLNSSHVSISYAVFCLKKKK